MIKFFQDIRNHQVITLDENEVIGLFFDCIFDYDNGKILAILVRKIEIFGNQKMLLLPQDIIKWNQNIYVRDSDKISLPEDIIRLRNYKNHHFSLIGLPVYTENKKKLGEVLDYAVSDLELCLKKISVGDPGFFIFKEKNILTEVGKDKIIRITKDKIIVKNPILLDTESELSPNYIPEPTCY